MRWRILLLTGGRRPRDAGAGAWHSENELRKEYVKIQDNIGEYEMPEEKIAAFLEEFPWVTRYIVGPICQVYVSRITPKLISKTPFESEEIYLIGEDGNCIPVRRTLFRRWRTIETGRSIWSALYSLESEKTPPVRFILSYLASYANENPYQSDYYPASVIVYKPPKHLSVSEWVRQQIDAEKAKIKQECAVIDSEASAAPV